MVLRFSDGLQQLLTPDDEPKGNSDSNHTVSASLKLVQKVLNFSCLFSGGKSIINFSWELEILETQTQRILFLNHSSMRRYFQQNFMYSNCLCQGFCILGIYHELRFWFLFSFQILTSGKNTINQNLDLLYPSHEFKPFSPL